MTNTVFYSWQRQLPNKTNRTLIQRALEQAIAALGLDAKLDIALRLDQDTAGVAGAPDIGATILDKIDKAAVFVADVSLITRGEGAKATPNPNVLIELGYAFKALGPNRVVLVFNSHYGPIENLPFDLRLKRALTYSLGPQDAPREARAAVRRGLENALRLILVESERSANRERFQDYVSGLLSELISFLMIAEQMRERARNPWFDEAQYGFRHNAEALRDLAVPEQALELGLSEDLRNLASQIDDVVAQPVGLGRKNWEDYLQAVQTAVELAHRIKTSLLKDDEGLDEEAGAAAADAIRSASRRLDSLSEEARSEAGFRRWEEIKTKGSKEGQGLLHLSYFDLSPVGVDSAALRETAMKLHQLEIFERLETGRRPVDNFLRSVIELADELRALVS